MIGYEKICHSQNPSSVKFKFNYVLLGHVIFRYGMAFANITCIIELTIIKKYNNVIILTSAFIDYNEYSKASQLLCINKWNDIYLSMVSHRFGTVSITLIELAAVEQTNIRWSYIIHWRSIRILLAPSSEYRLAILLYFLIHENRVLTCTIQKVRYPWNLTHVMSHNILAGKSTRSMQHCIYTKW